MSRNCTSMIEGRKNMPVQAGLRGRGGRLAKLAVLLFAVCVIFCDSAFATPERESVQIENYIGHSGNKYYTYKAVYENPGSHYEDYERFYMCEYTVSGSMKLATKCDLMRDVHIIEDANITDKRVVNVTEHFPEPFNAEKYLMERNVRHEMPIRTLVEFFDIDAEVYLSSKGMFAYAPGGEDEVKVLDYGVIKDYMGEYFEYINEHVPSGPLPDVCPMLYYHNTGNNIKAGDYMVFTFACEVGRSDVYLDTTATVVVPIKTSKFTKALSKLAEMIKKREKGGK